jgi:hypothetical protein
MIRRFSGALEIVDGISIARYESEMRMILNQPEFMKFASRIRFSRTLIVLWLTCSCAAFAESPVFVAQAPAGDDQSLKDAVSESKSSGPGQISPLGFNLEKNSATSKYVLTPEYSRQGGFSVTGAFGVMLRDDAAVGGVLTVGARKKEALLNLGFRKEGQQVVFTVDQLRESLNFDFPTGGERAEMTQNSAAVSYKFQLGKDIRKYFEANAYGLRTASRDLGDAISVIDNASLFELWNFQRRVAGGTVFGVQGQLGFAPLPGGALRTSLGGERLEYDLAAGKSVKNRLTVGVDWNQQLLSGFTLIAAANQFASERRYRIGVERCVADGHHLGLDLIDIRGRDGAPNDSQARLTWAMSLGGRSGCAPSADSGDSAPAWRGPTVLDRVAMRPDFLPSQVVAIPDNTTIPKRLIAVDKTAIPPGSVVNRDGTISVPVGVSIIGISSVSLNGASFANAGQFIALGNSLVVNTGKLRAPATGTTDIYTLVGSTAAGCAVVATVNVASVGVNVTGVKVVNCDTTPDAFRFAAQANVPLSTLVVSNAVTITGINAPSPISVSGGEYQIDGGTWLKAVAKEAATVTNGQTVMVRHTSSASNSTTVSTTLVISGVSATFSSTTLAATNTPPTISNLPSLPSGINAGASIGLSVTFGDDRPFGASSAVSVSASLGTISGFAGGTYGTKSFTYTAPVLPIAIVVTPVTETLTFTVTDSDGVTTTATVTFAVFPPILPANAPPTISNLPSLPAGIKGGTSVGMSVTFADDKPFGANSAVSVSASRGTISGFAGGAYGTQSFTYTAPISTVGIPVTETLTFTVTDSDGVTTTATVTFTVF